MTNNVRKDILGACIGLGICYASPLIAITASKVMKKRNNKKKNKHKPKIHKLTRHVNYIVVPDNKMHP